MCLAVPARLLERRGPDGQRGLVDLHGSRVEVELVLTPQAALGAWLLVHAGFAISALDEQEAQETFALLCELEEVAGREVGP